MTTGCGMHKLASISAAWTATAQSTALVASSMMKMYDQPATVNEPCSHIGQNYLQFSKIWFIGCHFYEYEPICCQIDTLRPVLRSALGQKWHFCFTSTQPVQHQHIFSFCLLSFIVITHSHLIVTSAIQFFIVCYTGLVRSIINWMILYSP